MKKVIFIFVAAVCGAVGVYMKTSREQILTNGLVLQNIEAIAGAEDLHEACIGIGEVPCNGGYSKYYANDVKQKL